MRTMAPLLWQHGRLMCMIALLHWGVLTVMSRFAYTTTSLLFHDFDLSCCLTRFGIWTPMHFICCAITTTTTSSILALSKAESTSYPSTLARCTRHLQQVSSILYSPLSYRTCFQYLYAQACLTSGSGRVQDGRTRVPQTPPNSPLRLHQYSQVEILILFIALC